MNILSVLTRLRPQKAQSIDSAKRNQPFVPPGIRVYAIGDIHGRSDLLRELHGQIADDAESASSETTKIIIYLGDYVDRGMDSKGVLDILLSDPLGGFRFKKVYLKGNHEDALLTFLENPDLGPRWFTIGGSATLYSYGVRVPPGLEISERLLHVWRELQARIPKAHLDFLSSLKLVHRAGNYMFVHAGVRPGIPLDQQAAADLMWIRDEFLASKENHGAIIVHGHSAKKAPDIHSNRIGIDTMAFASNILTCLVLEGRTQRFLHTGSMVS